MNTNLPKMRWQASLAVLAAGATAFFALSASPAGAATLANVSWTVTNNQVGATNVTYAYSFKTATAGTIAKITFAVSGTGLSAGTLAINRNFGIGAGTVTRSGQTITYTVTTPAAVAAGIPIYIEFSGLTNSPTAGSYTTAITTQTAAPATIDIGDDARRDARLEQHRGHGRRREEPHVHVQHPGVRARHGPEPPRARRPERDGRA